jgi:hypothetical protein
MRKALLVLVLVNLALTIGPPLLAIPTVRHTPAMLAMAHAAGRIAPIVSVASALLAVAIAFRLRRPSSWVALALIFACVALSRVSIFEWIFAPAGAVQLAAISQFQDIRDSDMVIGVTLGGESRAYPVRYLAYHHMVNDRLGPTALLPTY